MAYETKDLLVAVKAFARGQALPLDKDEVWGSLAEAQNYAKSATAYAGQTIKVLEDGEYKSYVLNGTKGDYVLKMVGSVQPEDLKDYVQFVESIPVANPETNVIYVKQDAGEGYIYTGAGYIKVFTKETEQKVADLETDYVSQYNGGTIRGHLYVQNVPTEDNEVANKAYVDGLIGNLVSSAPGVVDLNTPLPTDYRAGQTWRVAEAGTYLGSICEVGDLIICLRDAADGTNAENDFMVVQANIDGAVTGPDAAVDYSIAVFDGATGKRIKDGGISVSAIQDAIDKAHVHDNKDILDGFTKTQDELLTEANSYADSVAGQAASTMHQQVLNEVYTKSAVDEKLGIIETNLNTKTSASDVAAAVEQGVAEAVKDAKEYTDGVINSRIGDISDETTIKDYIDTAVGSGGTASAEAIAKAKAEAISTSKAYTDSSLELIEF